MKPETEIQAEDDRRAFLKTCGRFAVITPAAVTFLLSTSMSSKAIAASGGGGGGGDTPLGILAAGAGATALGAGGLPSGQLAPIQSFAPVQAPAAPFMAPPPVATPEPTFTIAGERG